MAKKQTKEEKALDKKIERIYYANCQNIMIDIMNIEKVFAAGRAAASAGGDDDAIKRAVVVFVETIREDKKAS